MEQYQGKLFHIKGTNLIGRVEDITEGGKLVVQVGNDWLYHYRLYCISDLGGEVKPTNLVTLSPLKGGTTIYRISDKEWKIGDLATCYKEVYQVVSLKSIIKHGDHVVMNHLWKRYVEE